MKKIFRGLFIAAALCAGTLAAEAAAQASVEASAQDRFSTAGFFAVDDTPREVYNFNYGWRLLKAPQVGAEAISFDDSAWEAANLPNGLEILGENGSGGRNYQGEAWYRKRFTIDRAEGSGRVVLYFEAAMGKSKVWVNGELVVEQFGGFLPFAADITEVAKYGGEENVVAVMVDNSDDPTYLPGTRQGGLDFSYFGGIYRDSYLIFTSDIHISLPEIANKVAGGGVFVVTKEAKGDRAELIVKSDISNSSKRGQKVTLKSILEDSEHKEIATVERRVNVAAGASQEVEMTIKASGVKLWHPDHPNLNFVRSEVWVGGKMVDCMRTRVGIRKVEMLGERGMWINGEPFEKKLIGANRHQDYVYVGNALPNSGHWRDVKLLREGGCNVIRVAHYPMDDAFYDACDELGMVTTTATPGWHFFNDKEPLFEQRLYDDTRRLVRKNRNNASIFMWETALNETPSQPAHVLATMNRVAHEEYPYEGMFTVTDEHEAIKGGMDLHYHGTNPAINSFTRECGDGNEVDNWYSQNALTRVRMDWGERALMGQAEKLAITLGGLNVTPPSRLGGALWAGIEHQRGYHPDSFWGGLLNIYRLPKYSYYMFASQYDIDPTMEEGYGAPMIYIANELTQISESEVIVYSNCEEVRLSYDGEVVATQRPSQRENYDGMPHPPFCFEDVFHMLDVRIPGRNKTFVVEMLAEGLVDGEVVVSQKKLYPLRSEGLTMELSCEGLDLVADGSDFVPVRAIVVDANGSKKVLASEQVYFVVEGEGTIIGDRTNCANPMLTQMGVATALIRSTTKAGKIRVTAYSNGLESATIEFESVAATMKMNYDKDYQSSSLLPKSDGVKINVGGSSASTLPTNVAELQKQISELQLELTGKEQEVMELRSQQGDAIK